MPCVTYRRQACFSCRYEQRRGVYGYPDVADGKNRLEEEINFSQRFTTALT
ncbi:hypothetical protein NXX23_28270 [Bacteroides ovatus]|nr:hypothetical protein [Bacteroides ovatus]MCS2350696.1 hypothetical protein [Bacteroides thetaiotaomicron]MCS2675812.1 hypothetical protein [Bacteroides ovatus]MCS3251777.1 hypothetical protein [Bacteroides ovatus]UVR76166.1 hypothetical protein NXX35_12990 [Bacteroides xylanisolvens]